MSVRYWTVIIYHNSYCRYVSSMINWYPCKISATIIKAFLPYPVKSCPRTWHDYDMALRAVTVWIWRDNIIFVMILQTQKGQTFQSRGVCECILATYPILRKQISFNNDTIWASIYNSNWKTLIYSDWIDVLLRNDHQTWVRPYLQLCFLNELYDNYRLTYLLSNENGGIRTSKTVPSDLSILYVPLEVEKSRKIEFK